MDKQEKIRLRLDRALTKAGFGTRKEARALIKHKRVTVNGDLITDHGFIISDPAKTQLTVDGEVVAIRKNTHLMMNKPMGYLTAHKDSRYPVIFSLLPPEFFSLALTSVGRLDLDTEGLLLLTTDGELAHRLMSPKYRIGKRYRIIYLGRPFGPEEVELFSQGMTLADATVLLPAELEPLSDHEAELTIFEGRHHQVKRMLLASEREVSYLERIALAGLKLDPTLERGEYRPLEKDEIIQLYKAVNLSYDEDYL